MSKQDTTKLIYSEAKERLIAELQNVDEIASKFNFLFAFKAIILASLFTSAIEFVPLAKIGIGIILASIIVDLYGFWIRNYRRDPDIQELYENYKNKNSTFLQKQLILNFIASINFNSKKRKKIKIAFNLSITLLGIALILLSFQLYGREVAEWLTKMTMIKK